MISAGKTELAQGALYMITLPGNAVDTAPCGNSLPDTTPIETAAFAPLTEPKDTFQRTTLAETSPVPPLPPPPPVTVWQRIRRRAAELLGMKIQPERIPIPQDDFQQLIKPGNALGIRNDGKGNLVYPLAGKQAIIDHLDPRRVILQPWDIIEVIVAGKANRVVLFPETSEAVRNKGLELDYSLLRADQSADADIVFYYEQMDESLHRRSVSTKPSVSLWVEAMRERGFGIRFVNDLRDLESVVRESKAKVVMVSANENLLSHAHVAYFKAKSANPSAVLMLGGYSAVIGRELAHYYDIVLDGEGEVAVPILLKNILRMISNDQVRQVEPIAWDNMVAGLQAFTSGEKTKTNRWAHDLVRKTSYYPPIFSAEAARELTHLDAVRRIMDGDVPFEIRAPIGINAATGEQRLFIRSADGVMAREADQSADELYSQYVAMWSATHPRRAFPLRKAEFERAVEAIPISEDEIDILYVRYPAENDARTGHLIHSFGLYAQRGCRAQPDLRCSFCSIKWQLGGRRPSIEQIIKIMKRSALDGVDSFLFRDDQFVQDKKWLTELVDRIKSEGLDQMKIIVQTRGDTLSENTLSLLQGINAGLLIGVETLSATRAERMGKVRKGRGQAYVDDVKRTLKQRADTHSSGDTYYMITAVYGDTLADIAEDTLEQFKLIYQQWTEHGRLPSFSYNMRQLPLIGDKVTEKLSGRERAQIEKMPLNSSQHVRVGMVDSDFIPFAVSESNGTLYAEGVVQPQAFVWPEPIQVFFDSFGDTRYEFTIGDIFVGLRQAILFSEELSVAERVKAEKFYVEMEWYYNQLLKDPAMEARVISKKDVSAKQNPFESLARVTY